MVSESKVKFVLLFRWTVFFCCPWHVQYLFFPVGLCQWRRFAHIVPRGEATAIAPMSGFLCSQYNENQTCQINCDLTQPISPKMWLRFREIPKHFNLASLIEARTFWELTCWQIWIYIYAGCRWWSETATCQIGVTCSYCWWKKSCTS